MENSILFTVKRMEKDILFGQKDGKSVTENSGNPVPVEGHREGLANSHRLYVFHPLKLRIHYIYAPHEVWISNDLFLLGDSDFRV